MCTARPFPLSMRAEPAMHDPLQPHSHDPNPAPPSADATFTLELPNGRSRPISLDYLKSLPETAVADCYIISTGHGTSGPFTFGGVRLLDLLAAQVDDAWSQVEVVSGDGFGCRVMADEVGSGVKRPIILAYTCNGAPLTRHDGLVRLIVPSETDDALRQVKWVGRVRIRP